MTTLRKQTKGEQESYPGDLGGGGRGVGWGVWAVCLDVLYCLASGCECACVGAGTCLVPGPGREGREGAQDSIFIRLYVVGLGPFRMHLSQVQPKKGDGDRERKRESVCAC